LSKQSNNKYKKGDSFSKKAKNLGYRSRAALKLLEIQKNDNFLVKGITILDLGSSPGGWCQVSKKIIGEKGRVLGIDIKDMEKIRGVYFIKKDIGLVKTSDFIFDENILSFDVVLSDMAPNISGIAYTDSALMIVLLEKFIKIIEKYLKIQGRVLVKAFQGESLEFIMNYMKSHFETVRIRKPSSSRSSSSEYYLLGKGFKRK
tara:strand:- start:715 stop:1323 length:609 start_codon:yes stop_codon:yes gene_type:complete